GLAVDEPFEIVGVWAARRGAPREIFAALVEKPLLEIAVEGALVHHLQRQTRLRDVPPRRFDARRDGGAKCGARRNHWRRRLHELLVVHLEQRAICAW